MDLNTELAWQITTWEGSRREQLRRALRLTCRERLQALEQLAELARHFAWMRETGKFRSPPSEAPGAPDSVATPAQR